MHELGVIREAVKTVEAFAAENGIDVIDTIVLEIGELSGVIAEYVEQLYPAVVDGTRFRNTKLKIEVEEGVGVCRQCQRAFNIIKTEGHCPRCGKKDAEVISGRGFMIKEILIP